MGEAPYGPFLLTLIHGVGPLCTIQRLKAKCDETLSNFAFNFNLRRYAGVTPPAPEEAANVATGHVAPAAAPPAPSGDAEVGPGGLCSPRHEPCFRPSLLDLYCSL